MSSSVDLVRDTIPGLGQTGGGSVGTSAEQLSGAGTRELFSGVKVKADAANGNAIYVGFSNGVTSSTGYKLGAGDSESFPVEHATDLWIIGGASGQNYSWVAQ